MYAVLRFNFQEPRGGYQSRYITFIIIVGGRECTEVRGQT